MNKHPITVIKDDKAYNFDVVDLPHHSNGHCKFEVFKDNEFVAGFEPDNRQILHICKNAGGLDEELLYLLADEIERYTWYMEPDDTN